MLRFYRVAAARKSGYDLIDYVLDPSKAASIALKQSSTLAKDEYIFVSQIDVYPAHSETHEFLRVDSPV